METREVNDQRLVLCQRDGELSFVYLFLAGLLFGALVPLHVGGEIGWPAYLGYLLIIWLLIVAVLSRQAWHKLTLDRAADRVSYTRRHAILRKTLTMPLSAVHSIVVKTPHPSDAKSPRAEHRVVIRPRDGSGHYAIGFPLSKGGAETVTRRCNDWLQADRTPASA